MKFVTSKLRVSELVAGLWQLVLLFWVGGIWSWQLVVLPSAAKSGLAPLLLSEIREGVAPMLVLLACFACVLQLVLLAYMLGVKALGRDARAFLLWAALMCAAVFFGSWFSANYMAFWPMFSFLLLGLCGVLLALQPTPGCSCQK